jgi:prepilin-type N-terminal cleavage/methylation domain-containing protein
MTDQSMADATPALTPDLPTGNQAGFSLVEVLVSMLLLTSSLMGIAQVFMVGMTHASASSPNLIAREKAREAIESVHTARDTRTITWSRIRNVTARVCPGVPVPAGWINTPGVFVNGAQAGGLHAPGPDGLVNTAGDEAEPLEAVQHLGGDGIRGSADDWTQDMSQYTREIWICDHSNALREVRVSVRYRIGAIERTYRLTTFVSNYS